MMRKWVGISVLALTALAMLNTSGCAHSQQLTAITLSPSGGFVFGGYGAAGQFTAYGSYIHPPESKNISNLVTWSIDIANFGTVSSNGLVTYTRNDGCGLGQVTATYNNPPGNPSGSVMVGSAPVSGGNATQPSCQ